VPTATTVIADVVGASPPGGIAGQAGNASNFPQANPAHLVSSGTDVSSNPLIDLSGDGSGRLGPYRWDKTGKDLTRNGCYAGFSSSTSANIPTATYVTVTSWNLDPNSTGPDLYSNLSGGVHTIAVPGVYQFQFTGCFATTSNQGRRVVLIFKNGVEMARTDMVIVTGACSLPVSSVMRCAAGDQISFQVYQSTGGTITFGQAGQIAQYIKLTD